MTAYKYKQQRRQTKLNQKHDAMVKRYNDFYNRNISRDEFLGLHGIGPGSMFAPLYPRSPQYFMDPVETFNPMLQKRIKGWLARLGESE